MMKACPDCKKYHRCEKKRRLPGKRAQAKAETALIFQEVTERAEGRCECGCGIGFSMLLSGRGEMDHFYGRIVRQSIRNCWKLIAAHHVAKTNNDPSRAHWDALFAAHCAKHGYPFSPRIVHQELPR